VEAGAKVALNVTSGSIRYTMDGADPRIYGASYTSAVTIGDGNSGAGDTVTLKTTAVNGAGTNSAVRTMVYTIGTNTWEAKPVDDSNRTTGINFTFIESVSGLTADHITVINGTGEVTKGSVFGSGKFWTLDLTEVKTPGDVTVRIRKAGIVSESETGSVTVYKKAGWTAEALYEEDSESSPYISFSFDKAVTGFTTANIGVEGDGSIIKNYLASNDGKTWILNITVTKSGEVTLSITGIEGFADGKTQTVTVKGDDPPGPVTGLAATPKSDTEITLNWTNPNDADFDHVNISWFVTTDPEADSGLKTVSGVKEASMSFTVEGLINPNTDYTFTVKAVDSAGHENNGETVTATTMSRPEGKVTVNVKDFKEGGLILSGISDGNTLYWVDKTKLTITVSGPSGADYTSYEWALNGVTQGEEDYTLIRYSYDLDLGKNTLTVVVKDSDGVLYSKIVSFTVKIEDDEQEEDKQEEDKQEEDKQEGGGGGTE
jgi:hypothetical protein